MRSSGCTLETAINVGAGTAARSAASLSSERIFARDWATGEVMAAPYDSPSPLQSLLGAAQALRQDYLAAGGVPCALAPLVLMSDRDRTPDIETLAARMPSGSALIYREAFGGHDHERAKRLRDITRARGVQYLIGADARLAWEVGADGVHFARGGGSNLSALRRDRPEWLLSRAAVKSGAEPAGEALDALFVSSVFPSRSPSAGTPTGLDAFTSRVAESPAPVFALGGVTAETAPALIGSGAAGLASIDGLARALREEASMPVAPNPPNKGQDTIVADPKGGVSIAKDEGGELITYTATVAGESATGELTLRRVADGVWNANHTGVPNDIGGRGVGKALVEAMSADAQAQGWRIIPGCPFVAKMFERKPELAVGITD